MMRRLLLLLVIPFLTAPATVKPVVEVSVVTDWETVSVYGPETEQVITSLFEYANDLYEEQLDISIAVTNTEIPATESDDQIPNHTHAKFLIDELFDYRINNMDHYSADVMVLITKRDLAIGSTDLSGYANIRSVCAAKSIAMVELVDNGLDGDTLAHEIAHVLGAPHDGEPPCENESPFGYLMSSATHTGNRYFSQCSIDTIQATVETLGFCLFEENIIEDPPVIVPPQNSGGGGSISIVFLLMLIAAIMYHRGLHKVVINE